MAMLHFVAIFFSGGSPGDPSISCWSGLYRHIDKWSLNKIVVLWFFIWALISSDIKVLTPKDTLKELAAPGTLGLGCFMLLYVQKECCLVSQNKFYDLYLYT